jgi:hypothetical protein
MRFRFSMIPAGSLLLMGVLILGSAPLAAAQSLPPVNTERLTTGQQAQVREFVESRLRTLETADPASSEAALARRDLLEPMRNRDTSVAMRQAFAEASMQRLRAMVRNQDDQRAVSALLIAGNIADRESVAIIEAGLTDNREAVQIGAAAGAKALIRAVDRTRGATQAQRQQQVQQLLGDALAVTPSGYVAQSAIGALAALPEDPAFMALSSGLISEAMASQAARRRALPASQALGSGWAGAMERAIAAQLAYQRSAAIAGADVSRDTQLQSARLAGIALSLVRDHLTFADRESGPDEMRAVLADHARLIRTGETLLVLVEAGLTARTDRQAVMGAHINSGDLRALTGAINTWVGPSGVLTGAPFSFRAADFGR